MASELPSDKTIAGVIQIKISDHYFKITTILLINNNCYNINPIFKSTN